MSKAITVAKWNAFLIEYANTLNLVASCRKTGVNPATAYYRLNKPEYREELDKIITEIKLELKDVAHTIAIKDKDPQMVKWLLQKYYPEEFGDKQKIEATITHTVSQMSEEELRRLTER